MFRRMLNGLYGLCGLLACLSIVSIVVIVLAQIIGRLFNLMIPSADDFAGYALVGSTFLGLAYTFRHDGHIRVSIFTRMLPKRWQIRAETYALAVAAAAMGYVSWYAFDMVWTSYVFGDVSTGLVPVPLWIPQSGIFIGVFLMTVSMIDELVETLTGRQPTCVKQEADIFTAE